MVNIKEYRIILPLTPEEYQVGQLYMVAKLSSQETHGGEGVEVLKNEPFENEDLGKGQYTEKIYHIGQRMPGWLRAVAPSSALKLEEKAWNAYPYCRTILTCPFMAKFEIKIETWHIADRGTSENVHKLAPAVLKKRVVDVIDISKDKIDPKKYKESEDPALFRSTKLGRGPFTGDWIQSSNPVMCAYKLTTVTFDYFGLAGTIEKTIHGFERDLFLNSHRQLVCWMDEFHGMTMAQIREMEAETKERLALQLQKDKAEIDAEGGGGGAGAPAAAHD